MSRPPNNLPKLSPDEQKFVERNLLPMPELPGLPSPGRASGGTRSRGRGGGVDAERLAEAVARKVVEILQLDPDEQARRLNADPAPGPEPAPAPGSTDDAASTRADADGEEPAGEPAELESADDPDDGVERILERLDRLAMQLEELRQEVGGPNEGARLG